MIKYTFKESISEETKGELEKWAEQTKSELIEQGKGSRNNFYCVAAIKGDIVNCRLYYKSWLDNMVYIQYKDVAKDISPDAPQNVLDFAKRIEYDHYGKYTLKVKQKSVRGKRRWFIIIYRNDEKHSEYRFSEAAPKYKKWVKKAKNKALKYLKTTEDNIKVLCGYNPANNDNEPEWNMTILSRTLDCPLIIWKYDDKFATQEKAFGVNREFPNAVGKWGKYTLGLAVGGSIMACMPSIGYDIDKPNNREKWYIEIWHMGALMGICICAD